MHVQGCIRRREPVVVTYYTVLELEWKSSKVENRLLLCVLRRRLKCIFLKVKLFWPVFIHTWLFLPKWLAIFTKISIFSGNIWLKPRFWIVKNLSVTFGILWNQPFSSNVVSTFWREIQMKWKSQMSVWLMKILPSQCQKTRSSS